MRRGQDLGTYAVCVSPTLATVAAREVAGSFVRVAAVAGFPSGAHSAGLKADEAGEAAATGAHEIDMVINLGLAKARPLERRSRKRSPPPGERCPAPPC